MVALLTDDNAVLKQNLGAQYSIISAMLYQSMFEIETVDRLSCTIVLLKFLPGQSTSLRDIF